AVYTVRYEKNGVGHDVVHSAMVVVVAFLIVVLIGASLYNIAMELDDAVFLSVAMVTNTGTGSGALFSGYADMPVWMKMMSCVLMFLGRMEILAILAIFTPGFWLEYVGRGGINDIKSKFSISNRVKASRKKRESQSDDIVMEEQSDEDFSA
ncbi:MAG: hypothetical protein J5673_00405, partial [Candidatus Methanomethylophilaceae archaeon]|nr:hypothetical protein [Candidatus Methanomethylophilaceae archaeon]